MLCVVLFILPLQIYIISDGIGIGIQGAVYRAQITTYGDSFIPLTREITFVQNGTLSGRSALSVILWLCGTLLLVSTLIYSFINVNEKHLLYSQQVFLGIISTILVYLMSSVAQYGFFFQSMAGIGLPIGILLILFWSVVFYKWSFLLYNETQ
jgi:hypothetical protein